VELKPATIHVSGAEKEDGPEKSIKNSRWPTTPEESDTRHRTATKGGKRKREGKKRNWKERIGMYKKEIVEKGEEGCERTGWV